jgi:hypothetical protein
VAVYVFWKSWSSSAEKSLLAAAVLLFILGSAKCVEKILAFKGASFNSLASHSEPAQSKRTTTRDREKELEEYVQQARDSIKASHPPLVDDSMEQLILPDKLFVDSAYPYSDRVTSLKFFFLLDDQTAYWSLKRGVSIVFNLLYTKYESTYTMLKGSMLCSICTWEITVVVSIVSISLFHCSHKNAYSRSDIVVSFVLLYGTFLLDIISTLTLLSMTGSVVKQTSDIVAQHSLIEFCVNSGICRFMKPCHSSQKPCHYSEDISSLIRRYVLRGWKEFITDAESYRKFNDVRGQWTLERKQCDERLGWSLERPFDESVLLWHIATDFCFHQKDTPRSNQCANRCREISNYMMHLLFVNPEMLMAGSRRNLFRTACDQLNEILACDAYSNKTELTQKLIDKLKSKEGSKETFIHDAWQLAEGLMDIHDETNMWEVIQGVWLEMLCFSASRCRGYLHAKSLGAGVEYLTFVWLLLAYAGMETLPERLQRTYMTRLSQEKKQQLENRGEETRKEPSSQNQAIEQVLKEEGNVADPASSEVIGLHSQEETVTAASASNDEGTAPVLDEIIVVVH